MNNIKSANKFAFDVTLTFIASVVSMLLGFIITIILARYLGATDLGLYRMTSSLYGIAMLFGAIGIPAAMIKYVAEHKEDRSKFNQIVSSGVVTSLFLGIGFIALFYLLSGAFAKIFDMPMLASLLKILSPVFPFALVGQALLGMLNGLRDMKKYGIATILQSFLMVIVTVTLIYYGFGVTGAVIGVVLSSVGSCTFLIWVCREYFDITLEGYSQTTRKLLGFGMQIFAAGAINQINYQADIVLIGYFLTATDVGYYAVAVGLSRFFWIVPQAIQTITYPATSEYWANNNHSALQTMIDKSMKYTACILFPIGLGVGFFAKDIITMIFGGGFVYSVLPLQILIVGTVINGATVRSIGGSLSGVGRPDLILKIVTISATTNIMLNILLIPYFGIVGAAVATTTSLLAHTFLGLFLTIRTIKVKIDFRWFIEILAVTFLLILVFVYLKWLNQYLVGVAILCIYIFIMVALLLTKEDRLYFKGLLHEFLRLF